MRTLVTIFLTLAACDAERAPTRTPQGAPVRAPSGDFALDVTWECTTIDCDAAPVAELVRAYVATGMQALTEDHDLDGQLEEFGAQVFLAAGPPPERRAGTGAWQWVAETDCLVSWEGVPVSAWGGSELDRSEPVELCRDGDSWSALVSYADAEWVLSAEVSR
jgi:hypothetical protein